MDVDYYYKLPEDLKMKVVTLLCKNRDSFFLLGQELKNRKEIGPAREHGWD